MTELLDRLERQIEESREHLPELVELLRELVQIVTLLMPLIERK